MGKIYLFNLITLDGFFEGPHKWEVGWHNVDDEFREFAVEQLNSTDILVFGRITYEGMASFWTTPEAAKNDPIVAHQMNSLPKIVFSRTLKEASWNNTTLIRENAADEMMKLKAQGGKDIGILGSANLAASLMQQNIVDEFRIMVNPVILGKGNPLFEGIREKIGLKLLRTRSFKSGNVLLHYAPGGSV